MADTAARLAISARRNEVARFTFMVVGIDMTGVTMAMQIRLGRDVPGAPLISLATVNTLSAEGLKLDSVTVTNGVPTSIIKGRINASTMTDPAKVPYMGEVGTDSVLAYAMQWTLNGDAQTRLFGDFIVVSSAFGSDSAPSSRPISYGGALTYSGGAGSGSLTFGDQVIQVSIAAIDQLIPLLAGTKADADRATAQAGLAVTARAAAEAARDASKGWAEGPVPAGGERSSKGWAGVSQQAAAYAGTTLDAIEQAIGDVPTDTRLAIEASDLSVLKGVPADTPIGRLALLMPRERYGPWQLRAGDYSAQIAADPYSALFAKVNGIPATTAAWVRIVPGFEFHHSWSGVTSDTADVLPFLKSTFALFPGNSKWMLPGHSLPMPANVDPTLLIDKPNVVLSGVSPEATRFDYSGEFERFFGIIQVAQSGCTVEKMHLDGIAKGRSSGNPAVIAIHKNGATRDVIDGFCVREVTFGRTSTGLYVLHHQAEPDKQPNQEVIRPINGQIYDVEGKTNGAAVSLFGAAQVEVSRYRFRYDTERPTDQFAYHYAFRILGTRDSHIHPGDVYDYPIGVKVDAAYAFFGLRAVNRDNTFENIRMHNCDYPYQIVEDEGTCKIINPYARRAVGSTNLVNLITIQANLPLSTIDPADPETRRNSIINSIVVEGGDFEGYSAGLFAQGRMNHITFNGSRVVGNGNVSDGFGERYSVLTNGAGDPTGFPMTIEVNDNDFLMTSSSASPLISLTTRGGAIHLLRNMLPETENLGNLPLSGGPVYTGGVEQRANGGGVGPGGNRSYRPGSFANWRDGTPIPRKIPVPADWTRNLVNVVENPANIFTKNAGASPSEDSAVYQTERFVGDFEVVYRLPLIPANRLFVGVIADYYGPSFRGIFHLIDYRPDKTSVYSMANDSQKFGVYNYDVDTIERWARVGKHLTFSRDGVVLVDVIVPSELGLRLQASISTIGDKVEILRSADM